jgi:flagellar protein FlaI
MDVNEIADYEDYRNTFKWNPTKDEYLSSFDKSMMLSSVSERIGQSKKELVDEIGRRKDVLHWMRERNIRSYRDVAAIIAEYYARPKQIYEKVLAGEEVKPVAFTRNP